METGERPELEQEVSAYSEVGERIAAILDAAEEAAERIRTTARDEAAGILRHAHHTAAQRVEELTREPERLRDEAAQAAHRTREEADAYAAETRSDADRAARDAVATAQREADELRQAAHDEVRRIEEDGRRRGQEIAAEIKALTDLRDDTARRVQEVVAGLRSAASGLEERVLPFVDEAAAAAAAERAPSGIFSRLRRREEAPPVQANGSAADDLYERAKALGIRGRSKMTREELEEAVREAG
jgi:hypothetical protein